MRRSTLIAAITSASLLLVACGSSTGNDTADFPTRSITLVVPYGAGGSTDTIARLLGEYLHDHLDVPVVVENMPGGVGALGMEYVYNADPDGYTIGMASGSIQTVTPQTTQLNFDPFEMTYIASTHESVAARFVAGDSEWETIDDLVDWGTDPQNELIDATSGGISVNDIATAALSEAVGGLNYRVLGTDGGAEAVLAILAGDADMNQNSATATLEYIESGDLRALLVESPSWPALEEAGVPTSADKYGYSIINPSSIMGPPDMPDDVRETLESAVESALMDEDLVSRMENTNELIRYLSGAEAKEYALSAYESMAPLIDELGARAE